MIQQTPIPSESEILRNCVAVFHALQVPVWRRNVLAISATYGGKRRFIKGGERGQADLWGMLPNPNILRSRHFECEVKRPGKRPTLSQVRWLLEVNAITGCAFWVDDPRILKVILEQLLCGARIVYSEATETYEGITGPSCDFDLEM